MRDKSLGASLTDDLFSLLMLTRPLSLQGAGSFMHRFHRLIHNCYNYLMRTGYVYLLDYGNGKTFKIGTSRNPKKRYQGVKADVRCDSLQPVIEVLCFEDAYNLERQLHQEFAPRHLSGEWFRLSLKDIIYFELFCLKVCGEKSISYYPRYRMIMRRNNLVERYSLDDTQYDKLLALQIGTSVDKIAIEK